MVALSPKESYAVSVSEPSALLISLESSSLEVSSPKVDPSSLLSEGSSIFSTSMGSSIVLEKSNRGVGLRKEHHRLEGVLTFSGSLDFLGQLLEAMFFSLAILSFLVGLLEEEVNPTEKKRNKISIR